MSICFYVNKSLNIFHIRLIMQDASSPQKETPFPCFYLKKSLNICLLSARVFNLCYIFLFNYFIFLPSFLREHDAKFKRLWFLWSNNGNALSSGSETSRCGCIGGCAFFGTNRNGQKFFKPTAQDVHDNYNIARYL